MTTVITTLSDTIRESLIGKTISVYEYPLHNLASKYAYHNTIRSSTDSNKPVDKLITDVIVHLADYAEAHVEILFDSGSFNISLDTTIFLKLKDESTKK